MPILHLKSSSRSATTRNFSTGSILNSCDWDCQIADVVWTITGGSGGINKRSLVSRLLFLWISGGIITKNSSTYSTCVSKMASNTNIHCLKAHLLTISSWKFSTSTIRRIICQWKWQFRHSHDWRGHEKEVKKIFWTTKCDPNSTFWETKWDRLRNLVHCWRRLTGKKRDNISGKMHCTLQCSMPSSCKLSDLTNIQHR